MRIFTKKIKFLIFVFIIIYMMLFATPNISHAFRFNPERGTYNTIYKNFNIIASESGPDVNAVKIHLKSTNARFNYYTPPSGDQWLAPIGECTGQKRYTANELCLSIAKTTDILPGESLGIVNIEFTTYGTAKIDILDDSYYTDGESIFTVNGNAGTYSIDSSAGTGGNGGEGTTPTSTPVPTQITPTEPVTTPGVTEEPEITPTAEVTPTEVVSGPEDPDDEEPTPTVEQVVVPTTSDDGGPTDQDPDDTDTGTSLLILFICGLLLIAALFGVALFLIRRRNQNNDFGPTYDEVNVNVESSNNDDPYGINF